MISCRISTVLLVLCVLWMNPGSSTAEPSREELMIGIKMFAFDMSKGWMNEGGKMVFRKEDSQCNKTAIESVVGAKLIREALEMPLLGQPKQRSQSSQEEDKLDLDTGSCPFRGELVCVEKTCKKCDNVSDDQTDGVMLAVACDEGGKIKKIGDSPANQEDVQVLLKLKASMVVSKMKEGKGLGESCSEEKMREKVGLLGTIVELSTGQVRYEGLSKLEVSDKIPMEDIEAMKELCQLAKVLVCVEGSCRSCGGLTVGQKGREGVERTCAVGRMMGGDEGGNPRPPQPPPRPPREEKEEWITVKSGGGRNGYGAGLVSVGVISCVCAGILRWCGV